MQTLNRLPLQSKPREKLQCGGAASLSLSELVAIILRTGCKGRDVVEVAKQVVLELHEYGPSVERLRSIKGLGLAKASEVVAACALGMALQRDKASLIMTPSTVYEQMSDLQDDSREHLVAFFLTVRSDRIRRETISIGTLSASLVHPREVFKPAIVANASKLVLAHTHPSGSPEPSQADFDVTKQLLQAGRQLSIEVIDHVICAKKGFTSLRQEYPTLFLDASRSFC